MRPVKTQFSLGIHQVGSESSLSAWRKLGSLAIHWVHSEDSDQHWADAQADLSLRWVRHEAAHIVLVLVDKRIPVQTFIYLICTLSNNILRWTYLGLMRFIHPLMTLVHTTLRLRDIIDKRNCWSANVTFDWRHVMVTAVEHNNQTGRFILFFAAFMLDLNQNFTNNEQKRCKKV